MLKRRKGKGARMKLFSRTVANAINDDNCEWVSKKKKLKQL